MRPQTERGGARALSKAQWKGGWAQFFISVAFCPSHGSQIFFPSSGNKGSGRPRVHHIPGPRGELHYRADPGYAIYQAPEGSCLTDAKSNPLSAAQPGRTGWTVAVSSFHPTRNLTGYYFAEHTGLKMGLKLNLSTQPVCLGGKRPRVGVIVALLCPSKSLTTYCPLNKYTYHCTHSTVRNTGRKGSHAVRAMLLAKSCLHTQWTSFPNSVHSLSSHKPHSQE